MTLKEEDQFLTDPIMNESSEILVQELWLQQKLRRLYDLERLYKDCVDKNTFFLDANANLRKDLMLAKSTQPYTVLNVRA